MAESVRGARNAAPSSSHTARHSYQNRSIGGAGRSLWHVEDAHLVITLCNRPTAPLQCNRENRATPTSDNVQVKCKTPPKPIPKDQGVAASNL
jgi:hypothetical protein